MLAIRASHVYWIELKYMKMFTFENFNFLTFDTQSNTETGSRMKWQTLQMAWTTTYNRKMQLKDWVRSCSICRTKVASILAITTARAINFQSVASEGSSAGGVAGNAITAYVRKQFITARVVLGSAQLPRQTQLNLGRHARVYFM